MQSTRVLRGLGNWRTVCGAAVLLGLMNPCSAATTVQVYSRGVGDGGAALRAPLGSPSDVAVDTAGNIYIADPVHERVRKVTPEGIITTIVGTGRPGLSANDGDATAADLSYPAALAVGPTGTLYVADRAAHRVRRVTPDGKIQTVAGTGAQDFSGDDGPATAATLNAPSGVAVDATGNLYIADTGNHRIRKVTADGIISTIAGTGIQGKRTDAGLAVAAELNGPTAIAVDGRGSVYFLDSDNRALREIDSAGMLSTTSLAEITRDVDVDAKGVVYLTRGGCVWRRGSTGEFEVVAGVGVPGRAGDGGPAAEAAFSSPTAIAVDSNGQIFVLDSGNLVVRLVDSSGRVRTIAGNGTMARFGDGGPANQASYGCADVVQGPNGSLYVSDPVNNRVAVIKTDGTIATLAGNGASAFSGDGGPAVAAAIRNPTGLAMSPDGALYVADTGNSAVRRVAPDGLISTVAGSGSRGGGGDGGPAVSATLDRPTVLSFATDGSLYIGDSENTRTRRVGRDGAIETITGATLNARKSAYRCDWSGIVRVLP